VARLCWPIAAAVLVAVGIYSAALYEHGKADAIEAKAQVAETERARVRELKLGVQEAMTKADYLQSIDQQLVNAAWHEVVAMIGHCVPPGAWLDSLRIDDFGLISVTGTAPSEDLVFDFVDFLQQVPALNRVNLEAQRPTRSPQGLAISFDIKCNFNGRDDKAQRVARND
jgi:Tfp pilus assembly protein PilN